MMIKDLLHCSVCRIQLKLPAGNTKVVEMDKADTLEALRVCVAKVYMYITIVLIQYTVCTVQWNLSILDSVKLSGLLRCPGIRVIES